MNRTCVDCTVFDPNQGMEGHPTFTTEDGWVEHRWKSHGGPKPAVPSRNPEKGTASRGFPPAAPGGGSGVTQSTKPEHDGEGPRSNLDLREFTKNFDSFYKGLKAQVDNLEEVQKIEAEEIKSWSARVVDLEEQMRKLQNPTA
jgi:hypothetical protein